MDVLLSWGTADIKDVDVSTKPPNWTGTKQEELLLVKGARLAHRDLTCARASRAFLANADLQGAQLACADLWEANLRLANLMLADLRGASLHFANLAGTTDPASGKVPALYQPDGRQVAWCQANRGVVTGCRITASRVTARRLYEC
jgi:uncharacterized protein YjbI with pentapeptide repeats